MGTSCVTEITNVAITSSRSVTTAIGEGFMVQGYTNINQVYSAKSANSPASTTLTISKGSKNGYPLDHPGIASGLTKTLYRVLNGMGYKPYEVTEAVGGTTYQYVSQCSNRGACAPPPACASASRATATTTATPRTCSPPK